MNEYFQKDIKRISCINFLNKNTKKTFPKICKNIIVIYMHKDGSQMEAPQLQNAIGELWELNDYTTI